MFTFDLEKDPADNLSADPAAGGLRPGHWRPSSGPRCGLAERSAHRAEALRAASGRRRCCPAAGSLRSDNRTHGARAGGTTPGLETLPSGQEK